MIRITCLAGLLFGAALPALAEGPLTNDYPTEARADYVFGCMAVNGETRDALRRCSCSIDVIASILTYDAYVAAETMLAMRQMAGERSALFRDTQPAMKDVGDLRRAQAEAEIICF
ncbi:MAG: hypothetical protein U1D06_06080 [Paracoccaceae bacterium]|nr:hypothetical protein [Paracoccaceae bacterium]